MFGAALLVSAVILAAQPVARTTLADSLVLAAERALGEGRPWRATRTVAPLLESSATRTPAVELLAARAAAGWQGWSTVTRLLLNAAWIDSAFSGEGRALLARALVEQGDPNAREHARRAVALAGRDADRGARLVVLARAFDRAGRLDSASAAYAEAARFLPGAADWLRLRAAGVLVDSARRAAHFAAVRTPAARERIRWTDALASERTGHLDRAARLYEQLGARVTAIRLRAVLVRHDPARARLRDDLVSLLPRLPLAEVPAAITVLDGEFAPLPPPAELAAARRAAAAALLERAARGFARAARSGSLTEADRLTWGTVLARLGRHREAVAQFERVRGSRRAEARYHRARSLFRTAGEAAGLAALRGVRDSFPADSTWAATAWWLLADHEADQGRDVRARREFTALAETYSDTPHGERAAFQAGLLEFLAGEPAAARARFDALARRGGTEATAAWYWGGRAREAEGDSVGAAARWRELLTRFPQSYYVVPAARRLGITPWTDTTRATPPAPDSSVRAALARAALLDSLGLAVEARFEWDRIGREAASAAELHAAARAFRDAGHPARALRLAQRALDRGAPPDTSLMRLLYPLLARDVLEDEARQAGVPPLLMAGLIRQESAFDPGARSRADARGLMQVLPGVGRQYARREGLPEWDPVLLYQPDVNLHFGLIHFAEARERCGGQLESALAAYNAGPGPVNRWLTRGGTSDPEVFIERIPYLETRDYVRRVTYNGERYASLYGGVAEARTDPDASGP